MTDTNFNPIGVATVTLPEGMTQEEADRLVREADEARREAGEQ